MSQNQPAQPHEQDDCEDCQKQRAQNNQLIQFYQRLSKIKTKVKQIKPQVAHHVENNTQQKTKLIKMKQKIDTPAPHLQLSAIGSKQMGYQLACALLERQIKMKRQNQLLSQRIKEVKAIQDARYYNKNKIVLDKKQNQQKNKSQQAQSYSKLRYNKNPEQTYFQKRKSISLFSDSLDTELEKNIKDFWVTNQLNTNNMKTRQQNSRFSSSFNQIENPNPKTTGFSSFQETITSSYSPFNEEKKLYDNMNLWLYNYNVQQEPSKTVKGKKKNLIKKRN